MKNQAYCEPGEEDAEDAEAPKKKVGKKAKPAKVSKKFSSGDRAQAFKAKGFKFS